MWNVLRAFFRNSHGERPPVLGSNAMLIRNEQLLAFYAQSPEALIIFDLRHSAEVERFPFVIPGALLTTRVNLLDLVDWIPPGAIVVLYGAERNSAYSNLVYRLPQDAHFHLLEGGVKSWQHARLPMEPVNELIAAAVPAVWRREPAATKQGESGRA